MGYTAIILEKESREKLIRTFAPLIDSSWDIIAHHMTINMGPIDRGPLDESWLGKLTILYAGSLSYDDKVIAVGVESEVPSTNKQKHITIAVNREAGGKPSMSNQLTHWLQLLEPIELFGRIEQID